MQENIGIPSQYDLGHHGLHNLRKVYWNIFPSELVEQVSLRHEGILSDSGAVIVRTGQHTGRSPNDKFIVRSGSDIDGEIWWGSVNKPFSADNFETLYQKLTAYFQGRDVFVQDMAVGASAKYRLPIRVVTESAWYSLFAHDLFIRVPQAELPTHIPQFTLIQAPGFTAIPEVDNTNSNVFVIIDFSRKIILIGGTGYAGEIKKSVFTIMNYLMPMQGVMSMHCSANVGEAGDVSLFFGLSGTGKTTLSSDPYRSLIGDDEHGWGEDGVFNYEGGCYAKTINLRPELEPLIWAAAHRFGTVLENVIHDPITRRADFDNGSLTENTRAAYPINFVPNHVPDGQAGHPNHVFFLAADAFGVMPPISKLSLEQAMYYFLSGYTSKLAGTEKGLGSEPLATFSTCFGAPFLPLHPTVYSRLLGEKISRHNAQVWLINTGWTGGPFGIGHRIRLPHTRAMVRAALTGQLDDVPTRTDPYFGVQVPYSCPEVPTEVLDPRSTWEDKDAYDWQARQLIGRFIKNFDQFEQFVSPEVLRAGPIVENVTAPKH